jgi:cobalt-zinc-cadmium efflux system membrane fusion protein
MQHLFTSCGKHLLFGGPGFQPQRDSRILNRALAPEKSLSLLACLLVFLSVCALMTGCSDRSANLKAEAPPPASVEREQDSNIVQVDRPEQFPLATADARQSTSELSVTGTVNLDVSRSVPVISIATGRVVEIRARLGDTVKKGQLLLRVQSADISAAFADHKKAVADERLARIQLERSKLLYDKGAISLNDLQLAQDIDEKAEVDIENTRDRLRVLGADINHPAAIVDVRAPISGVITDQQVTNAAGVAGLGSPNPFTISDLSYVWILCDVYENDLGTVKVGQTAEIRLNAYPGQIFTGRVSNILPILDSTMRTAKVRVEVRNPGSMRVGMFVTATFHGQKKEIRSVVPTAAILHLHDRDWVYIPAGANRFRRVNVVSGVSLPNNAQEIRSGIQPGQQVVSNALSLQSIVEQ